jgi:hypothetical protein
MLNAAEIVHAAESRVGIADTEVFLHDNLRQLVASINNDDSLPPAGNAITRKALTDRTADRLEGLKFLRDYPEIAREKIEAPVFLTGLPRSGTTFFQYLFDRDERFRLVRSWEAISPSPPPGIDPASVIRRRAEEGERRRQSRPAVAGFEALHLTDEAGPEECHAFLEHAYAAAGFHNLFNVPSYFKYLVGSLDFTAAYGVHKRQLQLLQFRMAPPRWALKYPGHVMAMDKILAVYPDARFVMTHRDPVQTLASLSKLTFMLREARYGVKPDPAVIGLQMLDFVRQHIARIMAFCTGPDGGRVTHVDYYRLVDNPAAVMSDVHAGLGIKTPPLVRDAVAAWHLKNPKGARGKNPYALENFGLNAAAVAEEFSAYTRHFGILREARGLAQR